MQTITCPHCGGCGKEPDYKVGERQAKYYLNDCGLCEGAGRINLKPGSRVCPECTGAGKKVEYNSAGEIFRVTGPCRTCKGRCVIPADKIKSY